MLGLAIFWTALSARQLLWIPDIGGHLPLTASIMAGNFPPAFPWNPVEPAFYHYGPDLMIGGLEIGTGLGFILVTEILGAILVSALILNIGILAARSRSLFALAVTVPLILSAGAWTLVLVGSQPWPLTMVVPAGLPEPGIRAAMSAIFIPGPGVPWQSPVDASPPNIFNPAFPLAYALVLVLIDRALAGAWRAVPGMLLTAVMGAFLMLTDETMFAAFLLIWIVVITAACLRDSNSRRRLSTMGLAGLAIMLVVAVLQGGVLFDTFFRSQNLQTGLGISWPPALGLDQVISLTVAPGNLGTIGIGVVVLAALVALGRRESNVAALLAVAGMAIWLASGFVDYEFSGSDALRLQGHARNLMLMATILVLAGALGRVRPSYRWAAGSAMAALIVWPTVARPGANLWFALRQGPQFEAPSAANRRIQAGIMGRPEMLTDLDGIAIFIREELSRDAAILSPAPSELSIATGMPAPYGFLELTQYVGLRGPDYRDAIRFLDPEAVKRLGVDYLHATPDWVDSLPDRSQSRVENPEYFEPWLQTEAGALYRIRPEFNRLEVKPEAESFEMLRALVGREAAVYVSEALHLLDRLSVAAALANATLFGDLGDPAHIRGDVGLTAYDGQDFDYLVLPSSLAPTGLPSERRNAVWSGSSMSMYAISGAEIGIRTQPSAPLTLHVEESRAPGSGFGFVATFEVGVTSGWTGQDWVLLRSDRTPWALPVLHGPGSAPVHWYGGQANPRLRTLRVEYDFDALAGSLTWSIGGGETRSAESSTRELSEGSYVFAARLTFEGRVQAIVPVLTIQVSPERTLAYGLLFGPLSAPSLR